MFRVTFMFKSGRSVDRKLEQEDVDLIFDQSRVDQHVEYHFSTDDAHPLIVNMYDVEYVDVEDID